MTEPEELRDPRAMSDEELATLPEPPASVDPPASATAAAEDEYAQGRTNDPEGAQRDAPAGEDYAGSGF